MPSFFAALRTRLKATPGLEGLAEVYRDEPEPEPSYPYMIINELFENPNLNISDSYWSEKFMQFTVHSRTAAESRDFGEVAYKSLMSKNGSAIVFDGGYQIPGGRIQGQKRGPSTLPDRPEGDTVWSFQFDYTFLMGCYE